MFLHELCHFDAFISVSFPFSANQINNQSNVTVKVEKSGKLCVFRSVKRHLSKTNKLQFQYNYLLKVKQTKWKASLFPIDLFLHYRID